MIDWKSVSEEAGRLLSGYLKIRSLNPPGDESEAAAYLARALEERGLTSELYESAPKRMNLISRLPGDGTKRGIVLYNHMDVVAADPRDWSRDPFSGDISGGFVYGRGAIDMKGMAVMQILAMDLLNRLNPRRTRDVIFFAAADEEKGGRFGAQWLIENHWDKIQAEYLWDEGGFGMRDLFGPGTVFLSAVAEKQDLWLRVTARGTPGHSGIPRGDNAAETLVRALDRILKINSWYRLHPVVRDMFAGAARVMPFPKSLVASALGNPLAFRIARPALAANPTISAMLRDTISVTVLEAGEKENIIPDKAQAVLDIRLLPDQDPGEFLDRLDRIIGDDRVRVEPIQSPTPGAPSRTDTEFYRTLSETLSRCTPGSVTAPMLTPGTTDSCHFRRKGVQCYGLFPAILDPGELDRFHGIDERISLDNLGLGTRVVYETLAALVEGN